MEEIRNDYILHFFIFQKFTEDYIKFINHNFENCRHVFILYGDEKYYVGNINQIVQLKNVKLIDHLKLKSLISYVKNSKKVILHGLFDYKLFVFINVFAFKKCGIVFWGGDIELLKEKNKSVKTCVKYIISKIFLKYDIAINLIEEDFNILTNMLKYKFNQHFTTAYYSDLYEKQIIKLPYIHNLRTINILIGNSATKSNNHFEIIDYLSRFRNEMINIYIPLSYGDIKYGREVEKYAKLKLGNKVTLIKDYMQPQEYNSFLNTIDIGIFNYHRQQGLGNINRLLILRKKVFINSISGMTKHYQDMNIKIYDTNLLKTCNFLEFIEFNEQENENNRKILVKKLSNSNIAKKWDNVFEKEWW